jgi:hypothetical protein
MGGTATPQFIVFACDESGAKGYADRDEWLPGEVGVFAGIMVPGKLLATVQPQFDAIALRNEPPARFISPTVRLSSNVNCERRCSS